MGIRLVALDIDGTILPPGASHGAMPSARTRLAVRRLADAGIAVVLASGRMFPGTASMARALGLTTPVVCQQGCSVHALDGRTLHQFALDEAIAHELAAYARELDHAYEWFNPLRYLVSRETDEARAYAAISGVEAEYVGFPERAGVTPTGVGIISTVERANAIHRHLVASYGDALHVLDFPAVTVAVAPDANKGHALSLLATTMGVDRHEVLAVGDSVNDATMLAWAGTGLAMAHSDGYALDAADGTLDPHPEALAILLESLVLG